MSYDDWDRTRRPQWGYGETEEPMFQPRISPGKRTLTMSLPPRRGGVPPSMQQAPVQQKPVDPAVVQMYREMDALSAQWMDAAVRPDLHEAPVQRKSTRDEEREQASASLPADGGGKAMPEDVQAKMEGAFGSDFSAVRIHEGPAAPAMGALAYTQGTDVHFAPGQYNPGSQRGQELLGHELTHVVQQSQGRVSATTQAKGVGVNDDAGLEREADEMGAKAAKCAAVYRRAASANTEQTGPMARTGPLADVRSKPLSRSNTSGKVVQGSFISFAIKMGAKQAAKGMLKNFIKTQIKARIKKLAIKKFAQRFAKEADQILSILEDPWWVTAIGFIPIAGDAFDLARVPKQIQRAINKADALEDKVKKILRIQHQWAEKLIPATLKHSDSYFDDLAKKSYAELVSLASSDPRAAKMKKLIEQQHRLMDKL